MADHVNLLEERSKSISIQLYLSKHIQHLDKGAVADGGRFVCSVGAKICTQIEMCESKNMTL